MVQIGCIICVLTLYVLGVGPAIQVAGPYPFLRPVVAAIYTPLMRVAAGTGLEQPLVSYISLWQSWLPPEYYLYRP